MDTIPSHNPLHGFWAQIDKHRGNPSRAWSAAQDWLVQDVRLSGEEARLLLDAAFGRHLADRLLEENALSRPRLDEAARRQGYHAWARELLRANPLPAPPLEGS